MTTNAMLTSCRENTGHALGLLEQLDRAALANGGLLPAQVRPQMEEVNRRLRVAQSAAQALANLAAGKPAPKIG